MHISHNASETIIVSLFSKFDYANVKLHTLGKYSWPCDLCQECQEKVEYSIIKVGCQSFHVFGEVTLASNAHECTPLVTLISYPKQNVAATHENSQAVDNQGAVYY